MADFDVVIIGSGPAGICAGIYLARSGRKAIILEAGAPGGQVFINHEIENYPGFVEPIAGHALADGMQKQVERLGVEIKNTPANAIKKEGTDFKVEGFSFNATARALVIATGARPKALGVPGEERLFGAGVSYCSTCDGMFFSGKDAFVIGGGNSALHGAEYLSRICRSVTIIHRRDEFRGDSILLERIKGYKNVKIMLSTELIEIAGEKKVENVILKDKKSSNISTVKTDAVFVYVGTEPQNSLVKDMVALDEYGYIIVNEDMATNVPGLYAAGDVIKKKHRQIVTAMSDGCIAALSASNYLK